MHKVFLFQYPSPLLVEIMLVIEQKPTIGPLHVTWTAILHELESYP
jgi:hypothetical protein